MAAKEQFGENMRRARHKAGLSQEALSARCGLHMTEISRLERGLRDPQLTTIVKVAHGLGVAPSRLLIGIRWKR